MEFIIAFFLSFGITAHAESKAEIVKKIADAAKVGGIDPDLAVAIATVESRLNPKAVGALGEIGVFQLRPEFHPVVPNNPNHNILIAIAYLVRLKGECFKRYNDAWFVTFNTGPNRQLRDPRKTEYYRKVMRELSIIRFRKYVALNRRGL